MSKPFLVSPNAQGRWMHLGDFAGLGYNVSLKFDKDRGLIVQKTIPKAVMDMFDKDIRYQRDIHKKGTLLGNTQKHMLPVASIPIPIYNQWKRELGDPKKDPEAKKKWRRRFNDNEFRDFRTSEHRV